jgi:hypothetical protein
MLRNSDRQRLDVLHVPKKDLKLAPHSGTEFKKKNKKNQHDGPPPHARFYFKRSACIPGGMIQVRQGLFQSSNAEVLLLLLAISGNFHIFAMYSDNSPWLSLRAKAKETKHCAFAVGGLTKACFSQGAVKKKKKKKGNIGTAA